MTTPERRPNVSYHFFAYREPLVGWDEIKLYLFKELWDISPEQDGRYFAKIEYSEERHRPGMQPVPSTGISMEMAQQLMDDLWRCGLRPTEGTGSAGSLAATERHLKDMRSIVAAKLNVDFK